MTTALLAKKIIESKLLNEPEQYTLQDLFFIRDCLTGLKKYNLEDKNLLKEVMLYLEEKGERK